MNLRMASFNQKRSYHFLELISLLKLSRSEIHSKTSENLSVSVLFLNAIRKVWQLNPLWLERSFEYRRKPIEIFLFFFLKLKETNESIDLDEKNCTLLESAQNQKPRIMW